MTHDSVSNPRHYTTHPSGVECIELTERLSFCLGNAVKYAWRASLKNGVEDLRKCVWYLRRETAGLGRLASVDIDAESRRIAQEVRGHEPVASPLWAILIQLRRDHVCGRDLAEAANCIERIIEERGAA